MKKFFRKLGRFIGKTVRGLLGLLGLLVVLAGLAIWGVMAFQPNNALPGQMVLTFDFTKAVAEKDPASPLHLALDGDKNGMNLRDVVAALDLAGKDPRVRGLVAKFDDNHFSMAAVQEIRAALSRFREQGKASFAFATSFGELSPADKAYYLASACESVWLQPLGLLGITGFSAEMPFLRDGLDKLGIKPDFLHREEYKTAMDMFSERDYTPANAEMVGSLLDDLSNQWVNDVAVSRDIAPLRLFQAIDQAPLTASFALQNRLIDHIGYQDNVTDAALHAANEAARDTASDPGEAVLVAAPEYLAQRRHEQQRTLSQQLAGKTPPRIAVLHVVGEMVSSGDSGLTADTVAADSVVAAIEDAVNDEAVEALLVRIDSPGGSAVAAETMRHALERAQAVGLPVVVSMGSMAGSGGYWLALQGDVVFAEPATLTGSIGVIAGKFTGTPELWDRLGVHWGAITRGANADLWSNAAAFTPAQRQQVDGLVGTIYQAFKDHVAAARHLSPDAVAALAKGRVWTGQQAYENGLIDELGGFDAALDYTKNLLGLTESDAVTLTPYPAPAGVLDRVLKMLTQFDGMETAMQRLNSLTSRAWQILAPTFQALSRPNLGAEMPRSMAGF